MRNPIDEEEKSTWSGGEMMYMQFQLWSAALLWSPLNIFVNNRILIAVQRRSVKARLCIQSSALSLLQWSLHRHLYLQRHHLSSLSSSSYYLQRHLFLSLSASRKGVPASTSGSCFRFSDHVGGQLKWKSRWSQIPKSRSSHLWERFSFPPLCPRNGKTS